MIRKTLTILSTLCLVLCSGAVAIAAPAEDQARPQPNYTDTPVAERDTTTRANANADVARAVAAGGVQLDDRTVAFNNGEIVMVARAGFDDCPNRWACLFDGFNWSGTMWQFQSTSGWQFLDGYGASNKTSSWRNRRDHDTRLFDQTPMTYLCMDSQSAASSLASPLNNAMDQINNTLSDGWC